MKGPMPSKEAMNAAHNRNQRKKDLKWKTGQWDSPADRPENLDDGNNKKLEDFMVKK